MADVVAKQVSVRDLKTHLSEWRSTHRLQAAIDAGILSWSGQKPVLPPPVRLSGGGKLVSEIVLEDRD